MSPRRWRVLAPTALVALAVALTPVAGRAASAPAARTQPAGASPAAAHAAPGARAHDLPAHVLTGYWQDFVNGAKPLRLSEVDDQYDIIAVAFADTDPAKPGGVTFTLDAGLSKALGGYTDDQFTADIKALHDKGKKVIISVGGANGTVSISDPTAAANFADSVTALMKKYGFDGVDIDLENGIDPDNMASALQQIAGSAGSGFVLTMAPQTVDMQSTGAGYFQLALKVKDILTIVNMQYYNSGAMNGCDGNVYSEGTVDFLTGLACIQLQGGLRPDQVGLGLPASPSGAGGGYTAPDVVNAALDCLASGQNCGSFKPSTTWPGIRGAMDWSVNWDAAAGNAFAEGVGPHLHGMTAAPHRR
jgi:chitinase